MTKPKVEFYKLNNSGDQVLFATCVLGENGIVTCDGPEIFVKNLNVQGVKNYCKTNDNKNDSKNCIRSSAEKFWSPSSSKRSVPKYDARC